MGGDQAGEGGGQVETVGVQYDRGRNCLVKNLG